MYSIVYILFKSKESNEGVESGERKRPDDFRTESVVPVLVRLDDLGRGGHQSSEQSL